MCGGRKIVCDVVLHHVQPMNYIQTQWNSVPANCTMHDAYVIIASKIQNIFAEQRIAKHTHTDKCISLNANVKAIQKASFSWKIYSCLLISCRYRLREWERARHGRTQQRYKWLLYWCSLSVDSHGFCHLEMCIKEHFHRKLFKVLLSCSLSGCRCSFPLSIRASVLQWTF